MLLSPMTRSSTGLNTSRTSRFESNHVPETSKLSEPNEGAQRPPKVVASRGPSPSWPGLRSLFPVKKANSCEFSMNLYGDGIVWPATGEFATAMENKIDTVANLRSGMEACSQSGCWELTTGTRSNTFSKRLAAPSQAAKLVLSTPSVEDRFSMMIVRSRRLRFPWVVCILCLLFAVGEFAEGQSATLTTEENFRAQQNGTLLGQLRAGMSLEVLELTEDWVQFDLDGWVWNQSLQVINRGRFDLVVSVQGGENIRGGPGGEILGHLEEGTVLESVERVTDWARVRRRAWVWRRSVALFGGDPSGGSEERSGFTVSSSVGDGGEWALGGRADAPILSAPDGDTLAISASSANLRILAREGNWARVRLEGWIWLPQDADEGAGASVRTDVTLESVAAAPDDYRGEVLQWDLQFISLERAEEIRTDFYATEPFLLTRMTDGDQAFVYVAVPPERLAEAQRLNTLERIRVLGRVRTGSARLTGSPILELLSVERIP